MEHQGYFFSASQASWLHSDVHDTLPEDAVPVTEAERALVLAELAKGAALGADEQGRPKAIDQIYAMALDKAKTFHAYRLQERTRVAIISGFYSNVRVQRQWYPTSQQDQFNLFFAHTAAQCSGKDTPVLCTGEAGEALQPHTPQEIAELVVAMNDHITQARQRFADAKRQIAQAQSHDDLIKVAV